MLNNIENIKNNSIGKNIKEKYTKETKDVSKKLISVLLSLLMLMSLAACTKNNNSKDYICLDLATIDYYISGEINMAYGYFNKYDISIPAQVSDYQRIEELKEEDLYGYYKAVGYDECEKIVQALGYNNWDHFLKSKDCVRKDGTAFFYMWEQQEYEKLKDEIREDLNNEHRSNSHTK